jgi:hypothetical protein
VPPGAGEGETSASTWETYRQHCFPTEAESAATIARARAEYHAMYPSRQLDVLYILTNANKKWVEEFARMARRDGWGTVVGSPNLVLDTEQREMGMAVDMEIGRRAEVFIGNGVSMGSSSGSLTDGEREGADDGGLFYSGPRLRAISCMEGWSTRGRHWVIGSGERAGRIFRWWAVAVYCYVAQLGANLDSILLMRDHNQCCFQQEQYTTFEDQGANRKAVLNSKFPESYALRKR